MLQVFSFFDKSFFTYEDTQKVWDGLYLFESCKPLFPGLKHRADFFRKIEVETVYFNEVDAVHSIEMNFFNELKPFIWYNTAYMARKAKELHNMICLGRVLEDDNNLLGVVTAIDGKNFILSFECCEKNVSFKDFVVSNKYTVFKHICQSLKDIDFNAIYNACFYVKKHPQVA